MINLEKDLREFISDQLRVEKETENSFKDSEEVKHICQGAEHAYKEVILWLTERGEG